jgi:hypothetical protein
MTPSNKEDSKKKPYSAPRLTMHGDIETITLGDDLGNAVDAAFTTTIVGTHRGRNKPKISKPKKDRFS